MQSFLRYIVLLFAVISLKESAGQDASFSQFYNNPIYYNPAYAGVSEGMYIRTQYRKQWPRISSDFRTCNFTLDVEEPGVSGGLGLRITSAAEGNGVIKSNLVAGIYSYRLIVIPREFIIQTGFQVAMVQKNIDYSGLTFPDQYDPILGNIHQTAFQRGNSNTILYPDFTTGAIARFNLGKKRRGHSTTTNTVGFAFHHLTQPNESFTGAIANLPIKKVFHAESIIPLDLPEKKNITFVPSFLYEHQLKTESFIFGMNVVKDPIFMGLWFRNKNFMMLPEQHDALIVMLGLNSQLDKSIKFKLGYSYDITVSKLRTASAGSHEITLSFAFENVKLSHTSQPSLKARCRSNKECFNKF